MSGPTPVEPGENNSPRHLGIAECAGVVLLITILSALYTWPLCVHPGHLLTDAGDPMQHLSVSYWTSRKLLSGNWAGLWDLPPIFYPARYPLAFGDPQLGTTLLGLPVFAASRNILLAYNFVVLISIPLCALGAYALARRITRSAAAALVTMTVWGFGAWHTGQGNHQQLLSLEFLPFLLLSLHLWAETGRRRWLAAVFACWLAQEFLAEYWGGFLLLLISPFTLLLLRWAYRLPWRRIVPVYVCIGAALLPWLIAQRPLIAGNSEGRKHSRAEIDHYSADLGDYLPAPGTVLWGGAGFEHNPSLSVFSSGEYRVSPGLFALFLAGLATLLSVRIERREAGEQERTGRSDILARAGAVLILAAAVGRLAMAAISSWDLEVFGLPDWLVNQSTALQALLVGAAMQQNRRLMTFVRAHPIRVSTAQRAPASYAVLAIVTIIWSNGYNVTLFHYPLFGGLHGYLMALPVVHSLRGLSRMGIIADLALAVLAGYGFRAVLLWWKLKRGRTRASRAIFIAAICGLILAENWPRRGTEFVHSQPVPGKRKIDLWLAKQPAAPMVELPLSVLPYLEGERLWNQITNGKPMRNGCETFYPPGYYQDVRILARPQSPEAVNRLRALGIRYVLLDTDNRYAGRRAIVGVVAMPQTLGSPYIERFRDKAVVAYELPAR